MISFFQFVNLCYKAQMPLYTDLSMVQSMIVINLDVVMAKRKVGVTELANEIEITLANLSILKNNKAKAVRLTTLDAICKALDCQPGDILQYVPDNEDNNEDEKGGNHNE